MLRESKRSEDKETVVLAHNSAIFSTQMMEYLKSESSNTIIINDFWLNDVHQSRLNTEWGQRINEFPLFVQKIIQELFPNYPLNKPITFNMFKQIRELIIQDLKKNSKINVIYSNGNVELINTDKNGKLNIKNSNGDILHKCHSNSIIYNTIMLPRKNEQDKKYDGSQFPQQTDLYKLKHGAAPKNLVIIGSGLSAVWVKEQCPESNIKYVVRNEKSKETMLNSIQEVTRNKNTVINSSDVLINNDIEIQPILALKKEFRSSAENYLQKNGTETKGKDLSGYVAIFDKNTSQILHVGALHNAIGYEPKTFPKNTNIIDIHLIPEKTYSPANLPIGALLDRYTDQLSNRMTNESINEKILHVQFENLFFRNSDEPIVVEYMQEKGINITKNFFTLLKERVKELKNAPETPNQSIDYMANIFQETYNNKGLTEKFKKELNIILMKKEMLSISENNKQKAENIYRNIEESKIIGKTISHQQKHELLTTAFHMKHEKKPQTKHKILEKYNRLNYQFPEEKDLETMQKEDLEYHKKIIESHLREMKKGIERSKFFARLGQINQRISSLDNSKNLNPFGKK